MDRRSAHRVRAVRDVAEYRAALGGIGHYFGWSPTEEDAERFVRLIPIERMHAAFDGDAIVSGAGATPLLLTIPGGLVPCAGVTVVGVLPSHRRRGLLRRMMELQLRDIRERGELLAALWASEETIYGRFGYGMAALAHTLDFAKDSVRIRPELARAGEVRLVPLDAAMKLLPKLYNGVARRSVGFPSRSTPWWETRTLRDDPESRFGAGPLNCALYEREGQVAGYTLYRIAQEGSTPDEWTKTVKVLEMVAADDVAGRELWRFVLDIDWIDRVLMLNSAVDDPIFQLVDHPNKLRARVLDGLWLRVIDVQGALAARSYATDGRVTLEIAVDPTFPDNVGTWTIDGGSVRRSSRRPDVRLDVQALGSLLLGGFSFAQFARSELLEEAARGGLARADALFRADRAPFCPEVF
jgi:predicted acetyltransferase